MREALRARLNGWLQHRSVFMARAGTPYLLLAVLAASTLTVRDEHGTSLLIDVSLCVVTAAWMLGMYTLNPEAFDALRAHFDGYWTRALAAFQRHVDNHPTEETR